MKAIKPFNRVFTCINYDQRMDTVGFVIFCIVSVGMALAGVLTYFLNKRDWKTRVRTKLLVTDVEPYTDNDGDTYHRMHYLVLDGEHAGARATGMMNSTPPMHPKNAHVDGWYNPVDKKALSTKEAKWERRMPYGLFAISIFTFCLGWFVTMND